MTGYDGFTGFLNLSHKKIENKIYIKVFKNAKNSS